MPTDTENLGALVAALAKAQSQFAPVVRDKEVTVTSQRTGKSYKFKYAPLESILAAVRGPLADNGLAIVQMIDEGHLETTLMHESGAAITGRVRLPSDTDIQGLGSAITYLRRYAIQAVLAIAAEEDDDGNSAAGNIAVPTPRETGSLITEGLPPVTNHDPGGIIGTAEIGTAKDSDFQLRETPDGWALGFRLVSDRGGIKVIAYDAIAQALAASIGETVGKRVTVWGRIKDEKFRPHGSKKEVTYQVLTLERIKTPEYELPATVAPGQEALELE